MAIERLNSLAWGIIMFAIVIALGLLVLTNFKTSSATCATAYTYNVSQEKCVNASNEDATNPITPAWNAIDYTAGQLGSSGLAGWLPVIIVVIVAGLIFVLFGGKQSY